jgi:adenylate cyclase
MRVISVVDSHNRGGRRDRCNDLKKAETRGVVVEMASMHRGSIVEFEGFTLDLDRRALLAGSDVVELRPKSMQVLMHLARNPGRVVSKDEFFTAIWPDVIVTDESLMRCISDIRLALDDGQHRCVKTVPRQGYLFAAETRPSRGATSTAPARERASIAVLPFQAIGVSESPEHVGDGLADDIITELSRFSDLIVIASNSSLRYRDRSSDIRMVAGEIGADYIVEGTIRVGERGFEITARLVDARDGSYRWAERFVRDLVAFQSISHEIVGVMVGLIDAHIMRAETERALLGRSSAWPTQELYLKATGLIRRFYASYTGVDLIYEGRRDLEKVIEADPRHARAYSVLAESYFVTYLHKFDDDFLNESVLALTRSHLLRAIDIDPQLAEAHAHYGHAQLHAGEHDAALASHSRASELNPNRADWRHGIALVFAGQHEKAIQVIRSCLRRDPFCSPVALGWMARAFYGLGRYSEALLPVEESTARAAGWRGAPLLLAATYARLGLLDRAQAAAAEVLRREPGWTIEGTGKRTNRYRRREDEDHFFDGLRMAGLPDR